jgi:hypothetical protein
MAKDPASRFASVDQLMSAVRQYLNHRGAQRLVDEAVERAARIFSLIERDDRDHESQRLELYGLFSEARFAFRQALSIWPQMHIAKQGLRAVVSKMVEFELSLDRLESAEALLAELEDPPHRLRHQLASATAARERRLARLEAVNEGLDPNEGSQTRAAFVLILGAFWSLAPLLIALFFQDTPFERHWAAFPIHGVACVGTGIFALLSARSSMSSVFNQRIVITLMMIPALFATLAGGSMLLGVAESQSVVLGNLLIVAAVSFAVLFGARRLLPSAVAYYVGFWVAATNPELRYLVLAGCNALLTANILLAWRSGLREERARAAASGEGGASSMDSAQDRGFQRAGSAHTPRNRATSAASASRVATAM